MIEIGTLSVPVKTTALTTSFPLMELMREFLVKPTTASTTYDVKIVDNNSLTVYQRTSETGPIAETMALPLMGYYTITISNATVDEAFTIKLVSES